MRKPLKKPEAEFTYDPPKEPLAIIHQDQEVLVVSKPAKLLTVAGRKKEHADCLEARVKKEIPSARIVHRLDMETSGLVIFALNAEAHRNLGRQFEQRKTDKEYIADIWGNPEEESGMVDLPLRCDWPNRPLQMIDLTHGKQAQTEWKVIERKEKVARVSLKPITGRTHQLRVHMCEIGHPIIGDDFYAHEEAFNAAKRLHLHAHKLVIYHPENNEKIGFKSPVSF